MTEQSSIAILNTIPYREIDSRMQESPIREAVFSDLARGVQPQEIGSYDSVKKFSKMARVGLEGLSTVDDMMRPNAAGDSVNIVEQAYLFNFTAANDSLKNNRLTRHLWTTAADHARALANALPLDSEESEQWHTNADNALATALELAVEDNDWVDAYNISVNQTQAAFTRTRGFIEEEQIQNAVVFSERAINSLKFAFETRVGYPEAFDRELVSKQYDDEGEIEEDRRKLQRSDDFLSNTLVLGNTEIYNELIKLVVRKTLQGIQGGVNLSSQANLYLPNLYRATASFGKVVAILESIAITNSNLGEIGGRATPEQMVTVRQKLKESLTTFNGAVGDSISTVVSIFRKRGISIHKIPGLTQQRTDLIEFKKSLESSAQEREDNSELQLELTQQIIDMLPVGGQNKQKRKKKRK
ncbi:MAG TPA: hypothetical protein VGA67_00255 [Candidatus Dojkabacteria bacterium]|jgi:hypothetical protein